jgi:hypothetical protein
MRYLSCQLSPQEDRVQQKNVSGVDSHSDVGNKIITCHLTHARSFIAAVPVRSTFKGKQFASYVPKQPRAAQEGLFKKLEYAAHPYEDSNGYLAKFPLADRKSGFYSHMPPCRDQFSKTLTTQQYRESIKRENIIADAALEAADAAAKKAALEAEASGRVVFADSTRAAAAPGAPKPHLYDLIHGEREAPHHWQKTSRDMSYRLRARPVELTRVRF